jgi:hypothetical protein
MSTALARRLDRVEGDHFAAAITHFADACRRVFTAPDAAADAAALAADPGEPEDTPFTLALWDVIELTTAHPTEQQRIRAALATVAPFVGLTPSDSPLPILAALEERLRRDMVD